MGFTIDGQDPLNCDPATDYTYQVSIPIEIPAGERPVQIQRILVESDLLFPSTQRFLEFEGTILDGNFDDEIAFALEVPIDPRVTADYSISVFVLAVSNDSEQLLCEATETLTFSVEAIGATDRRPQCLS